MANRSRHITGCIMTTVLSPAMLADISPYLLQRTQDYLDCRSRNRLPGRPLIDAWNEFYAIYDPVIRRFAVNSPSAPGDDDDCVQEVWATLIQNLHGFHYDPLRSRFSSWLYTLVHNKGVDQVRHRTRHPVSSMSADEEGKLCGTIIDSAAESETNRRRNIITGALGRLRKKIPVRSFLILYLRSIRGRSVADVGNALGLSDARVRLYHHRAMKELHHMCQGQAVCGEREPVPIGIPMARFPISAANAAGL